MALRLASPVDLIFCCMITSQWCILSTGHRKYSKRSLSGRIATNAWHLIRRFPLTPAIYERIFSPPLYCHRLFIILAQHGSENYLQRLVSLVNIISRLFYSLVITLKTPDSSKLHSIVLLRALMPHKTDSVSSQLRIHQMSDR